jgi:hypothetical protein
MQLEAAEERRLQRLREIDRERAECLERLKQSEEWIRELTLEIEPLKEEKANLVAQLKQVRILQGGRSTGRGLSA